MNNVTEKEIAKFKKQHCSSLNSRKMMLQRFDVSVNSFEELAFGRSINSYATGERLIENTFMTLKVIVNHKIFYPVFSESVAREMLKGSGIKIPRLSSVYRSNNESMEQYNNHCVNQGSNNRVNLNTAMLDLISFARCFMTYYLETPSPMNGVFKEIYDVLENNPRREPSAANIKSVNTALGNYIKKNEKNVGFTHMGEFIAYLLKNSGTKKLKKINFESLREKLTEVYPYEKIYF